MVRAAIRLLEQSEAEDKLRLKTLRRVTRETFDSLDQGRYTTFTPASLDDFFAQLDRKLFSNRQAS